MSKKPASWINTGGRFQIGEVDPKGDTRPTKEFKKAYGKWIETGKNPSSEKKSGIKEKLEEETPVEPTKNNECEYAGCKNNAKSRPCDKCEKYFCKKHLKKRIHGCEESDNNNTNQPLVESPIKEPTKKKKWIFISLIVLIIIIGGAYLYFQNNQQVVLKNEPVNINTTHIVIEKVYLNNSFEKTLALIVNYSQKKDVVLKGFLKLDIQESGNIKAYTYYFVDDFNNTIELSGLNQEQKALFTEKQTTTDLYEVSGILKKTILNHVIIVNTITKTTRDFTEIEKYK